MQTVLWSVGIRAATGNRAGYPPAVKHVAASRIPMLTVYSSLLISWRTGANSRSAILITGKEPAIRAPLSLPMMLTVLQIIDTAITLVFYTIIAVAAVLVLGAFFWIIDTINRFRHWLRGKRHKSMFAAPPRKRRKRRWWRQAA
jgi:hypothetical protein